MSWGGKPRSTAGYLRRPGGRRGPFEETFAASGGVGLGVALGQGEGWQMEGVNELSRKRKVTVQEQHDKILVALERVEPSIQHECANEEPAQQSELVEDGGSFPAAAAHGGDAPQVSRRQLLLSLRREIETAKRKRLE